ncbi:MAG TPA: asparagine synthase (glutamine-hydrolyzing) [Vicinamibacterales bacterium]|nr:asparagine synthase (glutamine-hydrolyzing) [Vicinamibacterales bacterium]
MCGIAGLIDRDGWSGPPERLTAMRDAVRHRGPDDAGEWWSHDRRVGLSQRRLAIIDLSPGGHQPMANRRGNLHITYNGEIYNYRELRARLEGLGRTFTSTSDTEVMLEAFDAWGDKALDELNGMFALALYDQQTDRVLLARDRAGEKPLYYVHRGNRLYFASELKALLVDPDLPRELDYDALNFYLTYGYVPGERCILRGFRKLAAGHALTFDLKTGATAIRGYWSTATRGDSQRSESDLVDELETLIADSVRLRLTASDVPVGILLSGGLDSSLITVMAARATSQPVRTFAVTFPGHGRFDEGPHARLVADFVGSDHTELPLEPVGPDVLPQLARQFDEPMADSSMLPTFLLSKLIRQHAKVALGGDGGDELFGGYPHYSWTRWHAHARTWMPAPVRAATSTAASRLPVGTQGRNHLIGLADDVPWAIAHVNVFFDARTRSRLLASEALQRMPELETPERYKAGLCDGGSPVAEAMAVDFKTYLPDDLLVKVDRASMASALEVRAPWLDHRLIEFAFTQVPDALRVSRSERKILLRRLARRVLPPAFDVVRKQGFSVPLDAWFNGPWGATLKEVLASADPRLFNRAVVDEIIAEQAGGRANSQRLFALAIFELWRREYRIALA